MPSILDQQTRSLALELKKLAEAARLGQMWSRAQGLRATQLTQLIRGAMFEARLNGAKSDPITTAHSGFDDFMER